MGHLPGMPLASNTTHVPRESSLTCIHYISHKCILFKQIQIGHHPQHPKWSPQKTWGKAVCAVPHLCPAHAYTGVDSRHLHATLPSALSSYLHLPALVHAHAYSSLQKTALLNSGHTAHLAFLLWTGMEVLSEVLSQRTRLRNTPRPVPVRLPSEPQQQMLLPLTQQSSLFAAAHNRWPIAVQHWGHWCFLNCQCHTQNMFVGETSISACKI